MLVITRFRYGDDLADRAARELQSCLDVFAERPGYVSGSVGRALDDPTLWVLSIAWENVGAYRRALSTYQVKAEVVPLLAYALDEPSAYEIVVGADATPMNVAKLRGDQG